MESSVNVLHLPPERAWTFYHLPRALADHGIEANGVIHIGAHHGEEVGVYRECGLDVVLVELDLDNVAVLRDKFAGAADVIVVAGAVSPHRDAQSVVYYRHERSVWSTTVTGRESYLSANNPTVAGTAPAYWLPDLQAQYDWANILTIDTQGTELDILKTAELDNVDLVIIEATHRKNDTASYDRDVVAYMAGQYWRPVERWIHDSSGYDDLLFVKDLD